MLGLSTGKILGILKTYDEADAEANIVNHFLQSHNLQIAHNPVLLHLQAKANESTTATIGKQLGDLELEDLVIIFELLIPKSDRKLNGAFFTPAKITSLMTASLDYRADSTIIDPSCGSGAFLIKVAKDLHEKFGTSFKDIYRHQIFGIDIAPYSVRRAHILLSLLALQHGEDAQFNFNIVEGDSLSFDWRKSFKTKGFDIVIGNPPYVKYQDLPDAMRKRLSTNWQTVSGGNFNLYFPFFEVGVSMLAPEGQLIYITPNNYFTSLAGKRLRSYLRETGMLSSIIDLDHIKVFNVGVYTAITHLRRNKSNDVMQYERINSKTDFEIANYDAIAKRFSQIDTKSLRDSKWRLLRNADQDNIKKIEATGTPLGALVDIKVGIATLADQLYFVTDNGSNELSKTFNGKTYGVEKAITRQLRKTSEIKSAADLKTNKLRIIFPYKKVGSKVVALEEQELKTIYPKAYAYLTAINAELAKRHKGTIKVKNWYEYGRNQALNLYGEKLLTPTFSSYPRFILDQQKDALFCNGYAVYLRAEAQLELDAAQPYSLEVLAKILNSKLMDYYAKLTSYSIDGGYACYQKNFIERFGVVALTGKEQDFVRTHSQNEVDDFLTKKYGLTFHESNPKRAS